MKKYFFGALIAALAVVFGGGPYEQRAAAASPHIVISQFQTAGGGSNSANDEFIELHNSGPNAVDLDGYSLVYRSTAGTNDVLFFNWTSTTVVPAGGYYLIASNSYDGPSSPNAV